MKVFNTLGRKIEEFVPASPGKVSLYTCGPTVYDFAHIGNLRSFVFDDTLRRTLEASGYNVRHVMNITDVGHLVSDSDEGEDKLEKGAEREKKTVWEVADYYIKSFEEDAGKLNILPPNTSHEASKPYCRATDFIDEQLAIVKTLMDKKYAYITEHAIYFDVSRLSDYGKLTGQNLSDKEVGARDEVVTDEDKRNPQDFALWFFRVGRFANHSMAWPSEWGDGFPGWHLECSAIIHATLGEPLDIHAGGVDHIGTHHTNEIAQSETAFGVELSKYWMHNEHLLVNNQKMSKSEGNYYTLKDVVEEGYEPLALRLLFLQSHYRSQANFVWEAMEAAQKRLTDYRALSALRWQLLSDAPVKKPGSFAKSIDEIMSHMEDDLNSPLALSTLDAFVDQIRNYPVPEANKNELESFMAKLDKLLGLDLLKVEDINDEQKKLLNERELARKAQAWAKTDEIRSALSNQGIGVNDTTSGQIWYPTLAPN